MDDDQKIVEFSPLSVTVGSEMSLSERKARRLAKRASDGEPVRRVLSGQTAEVRKRVAEIIEAGTVTKAEHTKLRKARITEIIANEDDDVAAKGIALSQKEDGIGAPSVLNAFQFNHFESGAKSGALVDVEKFDRESTEENVIDVPSMPSDAS